MTCAYEGDSLRLQVEDSWSSEVRQQFVRFVTGSTHMPHPGMELLRIELPYTALSREDHSKMLGRLPQVCTCRLQATMKPQSQVSLALTLSPAVCMTLQSPCAAGSHLW